MATVYRGSRLLIGDAVAIKILHPDQLRDPQAPERFRREAQAAARLKHPNAVSIYDFGISTDGLVYLVMELVEGQSLRRLIKEQGPLLPSAAVEIAGQVCAALEEAHNNRIVHRDIKPDNVIVNTSSNGVRVKVLDFGIARLSDLSSLGSLTQTGSVMGTPHYMSPEQCLGEELDGRADLYSLGVVLYEMLAGVVPFNSPTSMAIVVQHVNNAPAPLRVLNASIPPSVEAAVMRVLEKRRDARPATAAIFAAELQASLSHGPSSSSASAVGAVAAGHNTPGFMPTVQMRTPFAGGAALPPNAGAAAGSPSARNEQTAQKRPPVTVLVGGAAVVLLATGAGAYFLTRENPAPQSAAAVVAPPTTAAATVQDSTPSPAPVAPQPTPPPPPPDGPAASRTAPVQSSAATAGEGASADSIAVPEEGDITIRLLPGSTVHVDGTNVGTAGPEGVLVLPRLRGGRHLLVVRKERYRDVERTISVVPGQAEVIEIQPLPITGTETTTAAAPVPAVRHEGDQPAIADLSVDRPEVEPGQGATLRVSASDSNPDSLKYAWTTTAGSIDGRGTVASFRAPAGDSQASTATVTVTARNGRGLEAKRDIVLKLTSRAPVVPIAPDAMRRRAYAIGANIEVWLESPPSKKGDASGVVEAELGTVDNVWQVTSVQGNLPGIPVVITPECRNCEFLGVVESPNPANAFMRVRLRVKPISPQQPMGVLLRYQPPAPAKKK